MRFDRLAPALLLSMLAALAPTAASLPATTRGAVNADDRWAGAFPLTGCNGVVHAVAAGAGGEVYFGGLFTSCGGVAAKNIARFDPASGAWSALGSGGGNGLGDRVRELAMVGGDLYAGGDFTEANTGDAIAANHIARWDGTAWSALGSSGGNGVDDKVLTMIGLGGNLYVGGNFIAANVGAPITVNRIARWDGTSWSALGSGGGVGAASNVFALAAAGSDLYVGGAFVQVNVGAPVAASFLARWDGAGWSAVGSGGGNGTGNVVAALAWDGSALYVGGSFTQVNSGPSPVPANRVARWDGASWSALGSSGGNGVNSTVTMLELLGGSLYVGGSFTQANLGAAVDAGHIARWDGSQWSAVGSGGGNGFDLVPEAMAAAGGRLYVGGLFLRSNAGGEEVLTDHVAAWQGSHWETVGPQGGFSVGDSPTLGRVYAILVDGDTVYVGGSFDHVGGVAAKNLARYDRTTGAWSPVGSAGGNGANNAVLALSIDGGNLYIGGAFSEVNVGAPVAANRVARWDGVAWSALGDGAGEGLDSQVQALSMCGGQLYAGGSFTAANVGAPIIANRIARWDGASWSPVGSGAGNGMSSTVFALACAGGELVAGGAFIDANLGDPVTVNRIARWDGSAWQPLGSGLGRGVNSFVRALLALDDGLVVGGEFTQANLGQAISANRLARWDGASWSAFGSGAANGVDGAVRTIVVSGWELYVGGDFTTADAGAPLAANRVAHWTGSGWAPLGSGTAAPVQALAFLDADELAVGGDFTQAGGKLTHHFDFYRARGTLSVSIDAGLGSVISSPAGLDCPGACSANFGWDLPITLTPWPAPGYRLESWSGGGCTGTGPCVLGLEQDTAVGATFGLDPRADLAIGLADLADPPAPGTPVVYTAQIQNLAPLHQATGIVVTSTLPAGLTLVETVGCAEDPVGVPTCTLGSLAAGAATSFTIEASVDPGAPGHVLYQACVAATDEDPNLGNNCDTEPTQLDGVAPTVTTIDAGGVVVAGCTTVRVDVAALAVAFSEEVMATSPADPASVTNPANYRLVAAAPGADFDTVDCFSGTGGDTVVAIAGVAWDGLTSTASLALDGALPLAAGPYRLLVCGSIEDTAGNALDGGGGSGSDHLRTFRVDSGNLLADGHFDRYDPAACTLAAWTSSDPSAVELAAPDLAASPLSGSAHNTVPSAPGFDLAQCVALDEGHIYRLSAAVRVDESDGIPVSATLACELFDAPACGGGSLGSFSTTASLTDTGAAWTPLQLELASPAGTTSARCGVAASPESAISAEVFADQARLVRSDLFADGFESGDTSAWTLTVP